MAKRRRLTPARADFLALEPEVPRRPGQPPIAQVAGETAAAAAMAEMIAEARATGRLIQALPLDMIAADHLVRDRLEIGEAEMEALMQSLRARGQQTPIEVVDRGAEARPRYGLISGWRRLTALRRIVAEDGGARTVDAIVRAPENAAEAYVAMVEENEIRVGLSHYERARIVMKAVEQGVYDDLRDALLGLFGNAPRARRSKIKSFVTLVIALDGALRYPAAIPERLGLALARYLDDAEAVRALRQSFLEMPAGSEAEEIARLSAAVGLPQSPDALPQSPLPPLPPPPQPPRPARLPPQRPPVAMAQSQGRIVLSGPGADDELYDALTLWLQQRGHVRF